MQEELRKLVSVDRLLSVEPLSASALAFGHTLAADAARAVLKAARTAIRSGAPAPSRQELAHAASQYMAQLVRGTLFPVINATGVILHTNLGRAPLSADALRAMTDVAGGYSNLEYDLITGERSSRHAHAERLLCRLTGAEAALVVNNNAGAVFLALAALAQDREVVISRGQLVEIGGGFRIPDVLRASGARLVEVGTTNRTHLRDYRQAVGSQTALLLRVHSSNFRQLGFIASVSMEDLAALGREVGVPVLDDLGSGTLLDTGCFGLTPEPMVQQSILAGASLVTFSGDKLLGGPQAGLIVGRGDLVERLRDHPLARAFRVGKTTLAALQATLLHYVRKEAESMVPVWRMIAAPASALEARAVAWANALHIQEIPAVVVAAESTIGGGSLPGEVLRTHALALAPTFAMALAAALRIGEPPVIGRIVADRLLFDPRTVLPEDDAALLRAIVVAWRALTGQSDRPGTSDEEA